MSIEGAVQYRLPNLICAADIAMTFGEQTLRERAGQTGRVETQRDLGVMLRIL